MVTSLVPQDARATSARADQDSSQLLLFEVRLDRRSLTDALPALQGDTALLLPFGTLSRLLDLDVTLSLPEGHISGKVGQAGQAVLVDLPSGQALARGVRFALPPGESYQGSDDIYLSPGVIQRLLPVTIVVDTSALSLELTAIEKLPVQAHLERLSQALPAGEIEHLEEILRPSGPPAGLLSMPSFDVVLETGSDTRGKAFRQRYEVRSGNDLLGGGLQGYLASDDAGRPAIARLLFEQRDARGGLLGPLQATRVSIGDSFTPALALGPRGTAARSVGFSSRPLAQAGIFERIDLRGELALGHDVQLYVNDILRGTQAAPVQGRYEFLNVPLVRGLNAIRIVDYGPHGERSETTRVINVGGGQLATGETAIDFAIGQQERTLVNLDRDAVPSVGAGALRAVLNIQHGFTSRWTGAFGLARYATADGAAQEMVTLGARGTMIGTAVQLDGAYDRHGGSAVALALAAKPFGIPVALRHGQYWNGFVDETTPRGGDGLQLRSSSEATVDVALRLGGRSALPLSLRAGRDVYVDGRSSLYGSADASMVIGGIFASTNLTYERASGAFASRLLTGNVSLSANPGYKWQMRAAVDYILQPIARARAASFTIDRATETNLTYHLGLGQSLGSERSTMAQAGVSWRLPFGDLAASGDYALPKRDWRIGLQISFSVVRNPLTGRYALRPSGAASGGNLAIESYFDANGNGIRDAGDRGVAGVTLASGNREIDTDAKGHALMTALGYGSTARVEVKTDKVDLPYFAAPPAAIEFTPVPGKVATVSYPFRPVGEALVRIRTRQPNGRTIGISAVRIVLRDREGHERQATTEYDGSVFFEALKPGTYDLALDRAQAERLGMTLVTPVRIVIPANGGLSPDTDALITFGSGAH